MTYGTKKCDLQDMCDKIVVSEALMFRNGALMVYISKNKGIIDFWDALELDYLNKSWPTSNLVNWRV